MPSTPLTPQQLAESAKLKVLFQAWQRRRRDAGEPYSQESACEMLTFNQSALSQYLNGKIPLNVDAATKFATLIGCPVAEFSPTLADQATKYGIAALLHGSSDDRENLAFLSGASRVIVSNEPLAPSTRIKLVNLTLQAGIMGFESLQAFDDGSTLNVPTQWVLENGYVPHCLMGIPIKGDSMRPLLFERDVAIINIADTEKVNGGVYAFNFNGESVVKRLVYENGEWYLASDNPDYKKHLCRGGECIIVGRVVRFDPRNFKDRL